MRSRWNELLGVPEEIRHPNLYQVLGLDEQGFHVEQVEPAFRERMTKVQSLRSTKHKEFLEYVKGELRRALRVLTSVEGRREYDADLHAERVAELRRILVPTLAAGVLVGAAEKALLGTALLDLGMSETEALAVIDSELARSGAVRVDAPTLGAIPAHEGITAEALAELARVQAECMARLAEAAALRALEATRVFEASTAAPGHPLPLDVPSDAFLLPPSKKKKSKKTSKSGRKKRQKSERNRIVKVKVGTLEKVGKLERLEKLEDVSPVVEVAASTPHPVLSTVKFCAACGVSIPERWRKSGEAERVGARLLCSACTSPIRAGKACAGCSKELGPKEPSVSAGGTKRICARCAAGAQRLKVCASCQVILPRAAVERGEVIERDGKFLCLDCAD